MSDRRSLTSAANGLHSKGPATLAGKRRSSRNALRHGLLARCLVLKEESAELFQDLLARHIERFQPADDVELAMVEEMTASMWRLRRSWAIETRMLDSAEVPPDTESDPLARIAAAFAGRAESAALPLAHRYETRLHTLYRRALHNLLLLRAAVPSPSAPIPPESLALLDAPAASETQSPFEPLGAEDGSPSETWRPPDTQAPPGAPAQSVDSHPPNAPPEMSADLEISKRT